jgi:hypothetical protein
MRLQPVVKTSAYCSQPLGSPAAPPARFGSSLIDQDWGVAQPASNASSDASANSLILIGMGSPSGDRRFSMIGIDERGLSDTGLSRTRKAAEHHMDLGSSVIKYK